MASFARSLEMIRRRYYMDFGVVTASAGNSEGRELLRPLSEFVTL